MTATKIHRTRDEAPARIVQPGSPRALQWDIQQIQLAIARRAYELFESRNREHGHDWEDWFQAESELLRPVSIAVSESADRISIRANVLGFSEKELRVSVEPRRLSIVGLQSVNSEEPDTGQSAYFCADQMLRFIELPTEIDPEGAFIELQSGVLRFELPKATKRHATAAGKL